MLSTEMLELLGKFLTAKLELQVLNPECITLAMSFARFML